MQKNQKPVARSETYGTFHIARLCHVSAPTVAHWIDRGEMPSHVTVGGHRRVAHRDLLSFMRKFRFPVPPEIETC